tara:strand:+ start:739 stop:978 length:240 start_codon:yes stop_codon:yes gene_type:complete
MNIKLLIFCFLNLGRTKYLIIKKEKRNPIQRIKPKNKFPETAFEPMKKTELDALRKIPTIAIRMVKSPIKRKFPDNPSL